MSALSSGRSVRGGGLVHGRFELPEDEPLGSRLHQPIGLRSRRRGRARASQQDGEPRHPALPRQQRRGRAEAAGRFVREARRPGPRR